MGTETKGEEGKRGGCKVAISIGKGKVGIIDK